MIVCGGCQQFVPNKNCFEYGAQHGWKRLANMTTPRWGSASISIPGGILVTGGSDDNCGAPLRVMEVENPLKTSEIVYLNGTVKQAKPLPEGRIGHCLVEYQGQIISTGGRKI